MLEVDKKREATASIRGYFYQLDAALLEILNAGPEEEVVIEGIEDFDRYTAEGVIYSQVKYYAEQSLTDSVLRDPLHKLFVHFHGLEQAKRTDRKYVLYGHFSEVKIEIGELSVERFKSVMEYRKEVKAADGTKSYEKKSLLDGMAASDGLIEAFCKSFRIQTSIPPKCDSKANTIRSRRACQGCRIICRWKLLKRMWRRLPVCSGERGDVLNSQRRRTLKSVCFQRIIAQRYLASGIYSVQPVSFSAWA